MPVKLILHIQNADPIIGEADAIPSASDTLIALRHPTRQDGKELHFLHENAVTVFWPVERLNFIEVLEMEEEEDIFGPVRE